MTHRSSSPICTHILTLALAFSVGSLAGLCTPRQLRADQVRSAQGELIALTTTSTRGQDLLFLVDPTKRYVSAYVVDGRSISLIAGREYTHDHPAGIFSWYGRQGTELTPEVMRDRITRATR